MVAIVAPEPVDSGDVFLYHQTTHRPVHQRALAAARAAGADEALLCNERGEVTETAMGNLAVRIDGALWTPPLRCGLLPGVMRAELLERRQVAERVLTLDDLWQRSQGVYLINSVRRRVALQVRSLAQGALGQGALAPRTAAGAARPEPAAAGS